MHRPWVSRFGWPAAPIAVGLAALVCAGAAAAQAAGAAQAGGTALVGALDAFWAAGTASELETAIEGILDTDPGIEEVFSALRDGRTYTADVPKGRLLLSRKNADGTEHPYVLHVPEDYDPSHRYPVRVYLHGGVMRPQPGDGRWWPNDTTLARPDSIVVLPASWEGSVWWKTSQIENLAGLLNDLKRQYNIDENRAFLLGISDGATGAYYHAFKAPTPWAGFLPFNGHPVVLANAASDVDGEMYVSNLRNKPFFVINGALDRLYPADSVARFIRLFLDAGVFVDFRPQADAGHNMMWWDRESPSIDSFVDTTPRRPLPDRLAWETEAPDRFGRVHWLVVRELGNVAGETDFDDFNAIMPNVQAPPLGINMIGELQNRPGLKLFDVGAGSIAEEAGLEAGDILVEMSSAPVATVDQLRAAVVGFGPGDELPVKVDRNGTMMDLVFVYPEMPPMEPRTAFPHAVPSGRVDLMRRGNTVDARTEGVRGFRLLLSPEQFDLGQPIRVTTNGMLAFEGMVEPSVEALLRWAAIDQDRTMLIGAELDIDVKGTP